MSERQDMGDCAAPRDLRWIPGLKGRYLAHREGHVLNRFGKRLAPVIDRYGYAIIRLNTNGKRRCYKLHRLVCETFHGAPTAKHCAHRDGDKLNNHASNLRWATHRENTADAMRHGTLNLPRNSMPGEAHPLAKLSAKQVEEIRKRRAIGESGKALAAEYHVNPATISRIGTGKSWATREPSRVSPSRPFGRVSTIAGAL